MTWILSLCRDVPVERLLRCIKNSSDCPHLLPTSRDCPQYIAEYSLTMAHPELYVHKNATASKIEETPPHESVWYTPI
jgi:hypothetical protein